MAFTELNKTDGNWLDMISGDPVFSFVNIFCAACQDKCETGGKTRTFSQPRQISSWSERLLGGLYA